MFDLQGAVSAIEKKGAIAAEILGVLEKHINAGDASHVMAAVNEIQGMLWQHIPGNALKGVADMCVPCEQANPVPAPADDSDPL